MEGHFATRLLQTLGTKINDIPFLSMLRGETVVLVYQLFQLDEELIDILYKTLQLRPPGLISSSEHGRWNGRFIS